MKMDYEKIVYSRAPMGYLSSIVTPPMTKADLRAAWWENFWYCYSRPILFVVFWAIAFLLIRYA